MILKKTLSKSILLLILYVVLMPLSEKNSIAQPGVKPPISLILKGGAGAHKITNYPMLFIDDIDRMDSKSSFSTRLSIGIEIPFAVAGNAYFSITPTLAGAMRSTIANFDTYSNANILQHKGRTVAFYGEMPLLLGLRVALSRAAGVFMNAGPYLAYGLYSYNHDYETMRGDAQQKLPGVDHSLIKEINAFLINDRFSPSSATDFFLPTYLNRLDAGAEFNVGFDLNDFIISLDLQVGLYNIRKLNETQSKRYTETVQHSPELKRKYDWTEWKTRNLLFSIGYRF